MSVEEIQDTKTKLVAESANPALTVVYHHKITFPTFIEIIYVN
jgi:hypothetical protein